LSHSISLKSSTFILNHNFEVIDCLSMIEFCSIGIPLYGFCHHSYIISIVGNTVICKARIFKWVIRLGCRGDFTILTMDKKDWFSKLHFAFCWQLTIFIIRRGS
jgi:hypothetical protein